MRLSTRSKILFLVFVVLGVYYPSIFGGVNSVDDHQMLSKLSELEHVDWKGIFLPTDGYYYRPLLWSTFYADKCLWGLTESFMHLENVLLHAANTVLVFLLASKVLARVTDSRLELPLISALLFALHPINTESVAWISGRTDPLAALFVLASALFLMKGLQENRYFCFFLSTVLLLLGCLSKEVAVFFLPAACFIVLCHEDDVDDRSSAWFSAAKLKRLAILIAPFFLCGLAYLYLRFSSLNGGASGLFQLLLDRNGSAFNVLRIIFKAFGFYIKKLFLPLPLNFAIFEISDHYVWVGAAAFMLLILIARSRRTLSAFAVTACILIVPAMLVLLSHVAWTLLAERYLYLPSAFFAIALVGSVQQASERAGEAQWPRLLLVLLLIPAAFCTVQRNITWQSNVTLFQDTHEKSPNSPAIKNELAIALAQTGRTAEADRQLESAKKQDPLKKNFLLYVNQAQLRLVSGDLEGARSLILQVLQNEATSDVNALRMLAKIDENRLFKPHTDRAAKEIYREIGDTHEKLYKKTGNPVDLYRGGQMALLLGEKKKARDLFEKAYLAAPDGTYFKPAAKKLAERLKS